MRTRRQPSEQFLRRLKGNGGASMAEVPKRPSLIRRYKESDAWLWTEVAAVVIGLVFLIPTSIALWIDLEDRQISRITQAWELVTQMAPGNSGKIGALEYLNSSDCLVPTWRNPTKLELFMFCGFKALFVSPKLQEQLVGISLINGQEAGSTGVYLYGVKLPGAVMTNANLSGAFLDSADLSGALLMSSNLSGTGLGEADLSGADLRDADLTWADLRETNLSGADLSGADLKNARNLSQDRLDHACGDGKTQLSIGFTIEACHEK